MQRRTLIVGGASLATLSLTGLPALAQGWDPGITEHDRVMGDENAPISLIEYASFTCGHCANFHTAVLPTLKEEYIDTGRVRLIFRDFPLDGLALRAGMLARCLPESQYFPVVSLLFERQREWAGAENPLEELRLIATRGGMSASAFDACMTDEALAELIVGIRQGGIEEYGVQSTPTFVVNGEVLPGNRPIEFWDEHFAGLGA